MISQKEVEHIAKLARLGISEKEIKKFQKELSEILDYFEMLKKIDVSKVSPTFHPNEPEFGVMRKDEVKPESFDTVDKLVKAAPERKGRYVKVKAVLNNE